MRQPSDLYNYTSADEVIRLLRQQADVLEQNCVPGEMVKMRLRLSFWSTDPERTIGHINLETKGEGRVEGSVS